MKYLKDSDGNIFGYESDGSQDDWIRPGLTELTEKELEYILNPPEIAASAEDGWRDQEMPIAYKNILAIQFGETDILGSESDWKNYWLALRKWTADNPDFPDSTKRPKAPE